MPVSNISVQLGVALRRCRLARNLSQMEMALKIEFGLSTYRKMEAGDDGVALRFWIKAWNHLELLNPLIIANQEKFTRSAFTASSRPTREKQPHAATSLPSLEAAKAGR